MKTRLFAALITLASALMMSSTVEARHVYVSYVDQNRPTGFAQADVLAAIQRVMREWEAHNSATGLVFHWNGVIALENAPANLDNIVIRWSPMNYTCNLAITCDRPLECSGIEWPWECDEPAVPTQHILLSSYSDNNGVVNDPRWIPGMGASQDMHAVLMHEFGHLFRSNENHDTPGSVMTVVPGTIWNSRYLWNADILQMDNSRFPGHPQSLDLWVINGDNGAAQLSRSYQPSYSVLSPAALSVGDGIGNTGSYAVAYGSRTPAGSSGPRNSIVFKRTDGISSDFDRIYTSFVNGALVGTTYHRPCVAISASLRDYYLVWTSPNEDANGFRQVFSAEAHGGDAAGWTQAEAIPYVLTRTGVSCSIDRSSERLVVAYTGAGEEGVWLTSRPSLSAGTGQWASPPIRVPAYHPVLPTTTSGPPEIAFDFFATTPGNILWQDSRDLLVHSASVTFSGGTFVIGPERIESVDRTLLRSWPVVSAERNPILGSSLFTLPSGLGYSDVRLNLDPLNPFSWSSPYQDYPLRRYTSAASNLLFPERAFLSTSNTGI